ncbi:MAG: hypothetical protein ACI9QQ_001975 [Myxococcota bacterium]|jgi:hypothetical protein
MMLLFGNRACQSQLFALIAMAAVIGGALPSDASAASPEATTRPMVTAVQTERPPTIDGRLDEAAWQTAGVIENLQQKVPVAYGAASQQTKVRILFDADFIYIGIEANESDANKIFASTMVRDASLSSDDRVTISLDTYADQRNGFHFEVNPLGSKRDGLIENGSESYEWDGIWYADARINANGYVVEIAIPFQTLSIARDAISWGLEIARYTKRNGEEDRWASPTPEIGAFNMKGAGRLNGLVGVQQGIGLDVVPKLAFRHRNDGQSGKQGKNDKEDKKDTDIEPGVDAFYRITPSLTGALTVNTDFGEAEVDTRQINLTRFNLFFPEKRQFFLQDGGIFDFGGLQRNPLPFFSRRIGLSDTGDEVPIIAGTKVTGRIGPINVGLIDVVTDKYNRTPTESNPTTRVGVRNLAVARLSANILDESTAGVIVTSGDPNSKDDNLLLGADVNYRNSQFMNTGRTLIARGWVQHSESEGVSSEQLAWGVRLAYPNDRVNWYLIAEEVQRNFRPALGFTSRRGIRNYYAGYRFRQRPEGVLRTIDHGLFGSLVTTTEDAFQSAEVALEPFTMTNGAGDSLVLTYARVFEDLSNDFPIRADVVIPRGSYSWNRYTIDLSSNSGRPVSAGIIVRAGGFWNGHRLDLEPSIAWRPSRYLVMTAAYIRNDASLSEGDFVVHLVRIKADIQFNPKISWNTFVQYDNDSDSIGINTRLRWILSPGREFFAVINQGLVIQDGELNRGITEPRAKIGWTFRF